MMHIEDNMYEFFLELETMRAENLNNNKLRSVKEALIDNAIETVLHSDALLAKWNECFPVGEIDQVRF